MSCHNDLKPENILFDGTRASLIDWEAAFLNDRYMDLAIVGNFAVMGQKDEKQYLQSYFGDSVNEYHHARFFLMRQILHLSYFTYFMTIVAVAGCPVDLDSAKPGFREFHDQMWAGKISLAGDDARQKYAWVHMKQLGENFRQKRFEETLRIVSNYHFQHREQ